MKRFVWRAKRWDKEEGLEEVESLFEFKFHDNDFFIHKSITEDGLLVASELKTGMKIDYYEVKEVDEEAIKAATLEAMARLNKVTKQFIELAIESQLQKREPANI